MLTEPHEHLVRVVVNESHMGNLVASFIDVAVIDANGVSAKELRTIRTAHSAEAVP